MKSKIVVLLLSVFFLASCSSSRYGRIPKAKKQKHTVAKKQFRKKKIQQTEEISAKKPALKVETQTPQLSLNKIDVVAKKQTKVAPKNNKVVTPTAIQKIQENVLIQQILKPNKTQKINKEANKQEVAKGSWLWYIVVGLILFIVAIILPGLIGLLFYIASLIAILIGLLMLLGIL